MDRLHPVLEKIAPHLSPSRLIAYWFEQDSLLDESLIQALTRIRSAGTPVFLATNQEHMRATYLMESLDLSRHVDGIFYSAQLGAQKPSRDFFDAILLRTGFTAGELLFIDDTLAHVNAVAAAGWHVIHWRKNSSPEIISTALSMKSPPE